jgi:hypothetical protein
MDSKETEFVRPGITKEISETQVEIQTSSTENSNFNLTLPYLTLPTLT